jgi:hypothetical protein
MTSAPTNRSTPWWSIAASSWIAAVVAVREPRTVFPSTVTGRSAGRGGVSGLGAGGVRTCRYAPIAASSASPSTRLSRRHTVAG